MKWCPDHGPYFRRYCARCTREGNQPCDLFPGKTNAEVDFELDKGHCHDLCVHAHLDQGAKVEMYKDRGGHVRMRIRTVTTQGKV